MSKEANNYTTKSNSTPLPTGKGVRLIISGGGTGGHIFPAISIANAIKELCPDAEILFVGAEGRMEMQRVPDAGYRIIGLPVAGFDRKHLWKYISVLLKLIRSQWKARSIIKEFRPQVAVGVGGYASGPTLKMAGMMGIPTLIQEQNSYEGMEKFFPAEKIIMTGNPVRQNLLGHSILHADAVKYFGLNPEKKTILILGGSLGARTINQTLTAGLDIIRTHPDVQFIWQTGKIYIDQVREAITATTGEAVHNPHISAIPNLYVTDFIKDMANAYAAADLVISRAGAGSISEFCLLHKPVILVPSPNVAEDHQTKNALALVDKDAAIYVKDVEAKEKLLPVALETIANPEKLQDLSKNIAKLALPDSATIIAKEVLKSLSPCPSPVGRGE